MFKKVCIGLIAISLIASEDHLAGLSSPVFAADTRLTPKDLAIFAVVAGAVFVAVTYILAGRDRETRKTMGVVEEERRSKYVELHPNMNPDIKEAILRGELLVDMTAEQVIASWGEPRRTEVIDSAGRVREEWVYYKKNTEFSSTTYFLILVDGRLREW